MLYVIRLITIKRGYYYDHIFLSIVIHDDHYEVRLQPNKKKMMTMSKHLLNHNHHFLFFHHSQCKLMIIVIVTIVIQNFHNTTKMLLDYITLYI